MYHKSGLPWTKHWDFILLDILSMFLSVIIAYYIYIPTDFSLFQSPEYMLLLLGLPLIDFVVIVLFNSMKDVLKRGYLVELGCTARNTAIVFAVEALYFFSVQMGTFYSRKNFLYSAGTYFLLSYLVRVLYKRYFIRHVVPRSGRSLLIVTRSTALNELKMKMRDHYFDSYRMAGVILQDEPERVEDCPLKVVTEYADAVTWIRQNWVDEVLLLLPPDEATLELANTVASMGITVHIGINYIRDMITRGKKDLEFVGGYNVLTVFWNRYSFLSAAAKRLADILGGIVGCLVTAVLTLVIGPAIYIASPGPIFYQQERIGRNGKVFKMYKFRSMYLDADARKKEFMAQNRVAGGLMFKLDWDPRIIGNRELADGTRKTGIGEFIRKTSLDEFPQFFNVLKGDMSLVGTRPPTKDEWILYQDHHRARMAMRPGLTGMWQVSGRSNITDFEEIVKLDTQYIEEWSLKLDLKILLKTVLVVLRRDGSM